jgi:hypothetical protein
VEQEIHHQLVLHKEIQEEVENQVLLLLQEEEVVVEHLLQVVLQ